MIRTVLLKGEKSSVNGFFKVQSTLNKQLAILCINNETNVDTSLKENDSAKIKLWSRAHAQKAIGWALQSGRKSFQDQNNCYTEA